MSLKSIKSAIEQAFLAWNFEAVESLYESHLEYFATEAFEYFYHTGNFKRALDILDSYQESRFLHPGAAKLQKALKSILDGGSSEEILPQFLMAYEFASKLEKSLLDAQEASAILPQFLPHLPSNAKAFFIQKSINYFELKDRSFFSYQAAIIQTTLHNDFDGSFAASMHMAKFEHYFQNNIFAGKNLKSAKRFALTISGALRGRDWLSKINKIIADLGFEADVFFFTWDREYHWIGLGGSPWWVHRMFAYDPDFIASAPQTLINTGEFYKNFPHTYARLTEALSKRLNLNKIKQINNLVAFAVENEEEFCHRFKLSGASNCQKMWYGKYRLLQLLEEHEQKNGFKYDFIINLRPDGILENHATLEHFERMLPMDLSVSLGTEGVNDCALAGRTEAMKIFLSTWKIALENTHLPLFSDAPFIMGTHYMPHFLFMKLGIRIIKPFLSLDILNALKSEELSVPNFEKALEKDLESTPLCDEALKEALSFFERFQSRFSDEIPALLGAPQRVSNHLAYKLGLAMIRNSKTPLGYIKLPYILMSIKIAHQEERKNIEQKLQYGSKSLPPPLEHYDDYEEGLKIKNFLSYKLGEALMEGYKNLWGGLLKFYFADLPRIKKEFKNKRRQL
ncbi:hypothetical protein [Campylobacter sp.]|uniref:hypothetical protein n=1 Tax=Campylobacter sp. TaxID=205 RepID=UPI0026DB1291|nr:hypothetical protein [Campylobacter sp.]MDO4674671.1 hypothetical protein [Campylobacter sp.]